MMQGFLETLGIFSKSVEVSNEMKTKIILVILLLLPISCFRYRHVDLLTSFIVTGEVFDKSTGLPLGQINVAFIDTGFDYKRSNRQILIKIGESDNQGKINLKLDYWWGKKESIFKRTPKETFDIILSKKSYKTKILHFKASELIEEEGKLVVSLKKIYIEPQQE